MASTPSAWTAATDSNYTWYKDSSVLSILPEGRTLSANELTAYWPITASGFTNIEVRAAGPLQYTYDLLPEESTNTNTHNLYVYVSANTGGQQLSADIKLVVYSGSSAYSASTLLQQYPSDVVRRIYLSPESVVVSSAATSATVNIISENCIYSYFSVTGTGGNWVDKPTPTANGNQITFTFGENLGEARTATYSMYLYSTTSYERFGAFLILSQEAAAEPEPTPPDTGDTGDTAYTWYTDYSKLKILPTARTLTSVETTAYYPVTAHGLTNLHLRASGDVVFTYVIDSAAGDPNYNSHALYVYTEDNTGETRQESELAVVGYSGSSAYSATTMLFKNSPTEGWVTALPNPLEAPAAQNSISTYIYLTNCTRSIEDDLTGNTNLASWVSANIVNDTAITFTFQANTGGTQRHTYYMAYGRDELNRLVTGRIDLYQNADQKSLTITPSRASLSKEAGSFTCAIESTEDGTFTFSAASWMRIQGYSATTNHSGTLYVDYLANGNEWARTGEVKVFQQISTSPYTLSAQTSISQAITSQTANLSVVPTAVTVNRQSGYTEFEVSHSGLASAPVLVEGAGNMNIVSATFDGQYVTIVYGENTTSLDKTKTYLITASTLNGSIVSQEINITQHGTGLPVAPIWRDYVLDLAAPGMNYVNYNITYDGQVIYTGRAYVMPDSTGVVIFFNQLVKSYLSNRIDFTAGYQTINEWLGNFTISSPELGNITAVAFYEDYSYENRVMQNIMTLNNPITEEVPEGGFVPFSFFVTGDTGTVTVYTNLPINE